VQEPANGDVDVHLLSSLSQHEREEHEVIVVHPDVITVFEVRHYRVCKDLVRFAVCQHGVVVEGDLVELVVKQWPDGGVYGCSVSTQSGRRAGVLLT